jgi:hypothetical protein
MIMDLSSLETLGKVAGLGGIAIGLIALLVRPIIDQTPALPLAQRGPVLRLVVIGAFAIGALGIVAWLGASLGGHNTIVTGGPCSNTSAGPASGNSVSCGTVPGNSGTKP